MVDPVQPSGPRFGGVPFTKNLPSGAVAKPTTKPTTETAEKPTRRCVEKPTKRSCCKTYHNFGVKNGSLFHATTKQTVAKAVASQKLFQNRPIKTPNPFLGPGKKDPGISWSGNLVETPNPFLGPGKKDPGITYPAVRLITMREMQTGGFEPSRGNITLL